MYSALSDLSPRNFSRNSHPSGEQLCTLNILWFCWSVATLVSMILLLGL